MSERERLQGCESTKAHNGKLKHGIPLLETNQDRTGCDPEPEQVGRVPLVRATGSEVYHRFEGQADHGGHSGNGPFLHDHASKREVRWQKKRVLSGFGRPNGPPGRPADAGFLQAAYHAGRRGGPGGRVPGVGPRQ